MAEFVKNSLLSKFRMNDSLFAARGERLWELQQKKLFYDVVLEVDKDRYECHRNVLISNGGYFYDLFMNNFQESHADEIYLRVPDPTKCFPYVLKYLYTGDSSFLNGENAFSILTISWYLQLDQLRQEAETVISRSIEFKQIKQIIHAITNSPFIPPLPNGFNKVIASNFGKLMCDEDFLCFPIKLIKSFLTSTSLRVPSEFELVKWLSQYCTYNNENPVQFRNIVKWQFLSENEWNQINYQSFIEERAKNMILNTRNKSISQAPYLSSILLALNSTSYEQTLSLLNRYSSLNINYFENANNLLKNPQEYHLKVTGFFQNSLEIKIARENPNIQFYISEFEIILSTPKGVPMMGLQATSSFGPQTFNDISPISNDKEVVNIKFKYNVNDRFPFESLIIRFVNDDNRNFKIQSSSFTGFWFNINNHAL
ncbi:hypothetical protein TRFO_02876 [Tritrichomonas foetus]|uniref:BTB domain-containing protein n=1 Tax=Tritrichomonas foetus TaxID=1144522 RepID=A0A1J4L0P1_9EUKA|nr:hypothetical protein TRFO_02876 [Tritrichomonas foetus]|eukprot:OHT15542.1 hypothetical protein TRFO_02876 [Tritrichomonas foetus]